MTPAFHYHPGESQPFIQNFNIPPPKDIIYLSTYCLFILQRRHVVREGGGGGAQPGQGDQPEVHREEDRDRMESGNTVDQDIDRYNVSYIYSE